MVTDTFNKIRIHELKENRKLKGALHFVKISIVLYNVNPCFYICVVCVSICVCVCVLCRDVKGISDSALESK